MYPIPKVHLNHELLTYIIITKGWLWNILSEKKDLPLVSNLIQSIHEMSDLFFLSLCLFNTTRPHNFWLTRPPVVTNLG